MSENITKAIEEERKNTTHYRLLYESTSKLLKEVSGAMLSTCDKNCAGEGETGIPPCPLYALPDVDSIGVCKIAYMQNG